ncbi:MAG: hypothetical protein AAF363_06870 [Bacteroidota bacterium]
MKKLLKRELSIKKTFIIVLTLCLLWNCNLVAQQDGTIDYFDRQIPRKSNKEFQFIAYFYNQLVTSNFFPTNDFLRGQIIGRLYGANTTGSTDTVNTAYFEQRFLPFFIYQPKLLDGKVILRASFEIDWTWGDVAYGTGGNSGSAVSGDQVNIQTQNIEVEFIPKPGWAINLGLQRMFDTPFNPYRTVFDKMTTTAYRLMYFGTDAVGITVRKDNDFERWKAGYFQLYENNIQDKDDVVLYEFMYDRVLSPKWNLGGSMYYVRDRANGEGGPSILGQGLNSTLADYNGVFRFPFGSDDYRADVAWLGTYWGYNQELMEDDFFMTGFLNYNFGSIDLDEGDGFNETIDISGLGANLRLGYRHGHTENDIVAADIVYTTGDDDGIDDGKYSGVLTGNTWGTPASIYISSGAYILFPHGNVVNRFVSAVNDISNLGLGLTGVTLNYYKDIIPYKVNAKAGLAYAYSNVNPENGGQNIGVEFNGRISYQPKVFMNIELHAAYLSLGDFYDSPEVNAGVSERPPNPWTAFLAFKWLMF